MKQIYLSLLFLSFFLINSNLYSQITEDFNDESAIQGTTTYTTNTDLIITDDVGINYYSSTITADGHPFTAFIYATQRVNGAIKLKAPQGEVFYSFSGDFYYGSGSGSADNGTITMYYQGQQVGTPMNVNGSTYHRFTTTETFDELVAASSGDGHFYIDDVEFTVSQTLSTSVQSIGRKTTIYPNPATNSIIVSGLKNKENYTIYNLIGTEILKGTILDNGEIEINSFSNGLYVLKFENGHTVQFIKE